MGSAARAEAVEPFARAASAAFLAAAAASASSLAFLAAAISSGVVAAYTSRFTVRAPDAEETTSVWAEPSATEWAVSVTAMSGATA